MVESGRSGLYLSWLAIAFETMSLLVGIKSYYRYRRRIAKRRYYMDAAEEADPRKRQDWHQGDDAITPDDGLAAGETAADSSAVSALRAGNARLQQPLEQGQGTAPTGAPALGLQTGVGAFAEQAMAARTAEGPGPNFNAFAALASGSAPTTGSGTLAGATRIMDCGSPLPAVAPAPAGLGTAGGNYVPFNPATVTRVQGKVA